MDWVRRSLYLPRVATLFVAILISCLAQGCFVAGIRPRTGEILREGEVRLGGTCSVTTIAVGTVKLADGRQQQGFTGFRSMIHPMAWMAFYMYNSTLDVGVSPTSWLELDASVGYQEMGLDLRFPVLSERGGDAFSLAGSRRGLVPPVDGQCSGLVSGRHRLLRPVGPRTGNGW